MSRSLRATVLVNPAARGVGERFDGARLVRYLGERGVEASVVVPASASEATTRAREAADREHDLLFVVGGDGSMRDAAAGLLGSKTALAAIPAGTVNIWAKETGIPNGIRKALDAHLGGQTVQVDAGQVGGACFLLMAGVGWDAEVTAKVSSKLKRRAGDLAYIAQGALMAPRLRTTMTRWSTPSESFEEPLAWMVLSNTRLYGGRIRFTPDATVDDGELDVLAMCPGGPFEAIRLAGKLAAGKRSDDRLIRFRAPSISIETAGLPIQLDGDYVGETPATFSVAPAALLASVPAGPLTEIFRPLEN